VTLAVIDEKLFLTVFQPVLPLHECADPAAAESIAAQSVAEPLHSVADFATTEFATEPL
jgi:hypothetical protein